MKVDLYYKSHQLGRQFQIYRRCANAFAKRGLSLRFIEDTFPEPSDADLFVIQTGLLILAEYEPMETVVERLKELNRPIILEDDNEGATPHQRKLIKTANPLRVYRVAVVRKDLINLPIDHHQFWQISDQNQKRRFERKLVPFTEEEIAKVRCGLHLGMYDRMWRWVQGRNETEWSKRTIDVSFVGSCYGRGGPMAPYVAQHRDAFVKALDAICGLRVLCMPERCLSLGAYHQLLRQSRIVVSPWGDCEQCYREFEGVLDECAVIKPQTDLYHTLDDITLETTVSCQPDASDLAEVIESILLDERYREPELRAANRQRLLDWWQADRIAEWWCQDVGL